MVSPPTGGHFEGAENRTHRRGLAEGHVAVPHVLDGLRRVVFGEAYDLGDVTLSKERMHLEFQRTAAGAPVAAKLRSG